MCWCLLSDGLWGGMLQMMTRVSVDPDISMELSPEAAIAVIVRSWPRKVCTTTPSEKSGAWSRCDQSYTLISSE